MFHLYCIVLCFVIVLDIISLFGANLLVLLLLIAGWLTSLFLQMVMDDFVLSNIPWFYVLMIFEMIDDSSIMLFVCLSLLLSLWYFN
ncbi:hypothetical protein M6B38_328865 [Iris pallida]|uniref:NADH dehydrogenase subunit 4L n=1 Tax=Iris pallida TaxID=29817 RepID=A0AAX6H4U6_IRIPA|nr:hypothetical protein M6B38_328865 [Iris pallida]